MTLDDWKQTWQAADESVDRGRSDDELLRLVKEEAEAFDEKIRRRDRRETVAAVLVFVLFSLMLLDPSWLVRAGALTVMGGSAFVYWTLRRARTGHDPPSVDRPVAEVLRNEREKVDTQIQLLDRVLWWYFAPVAAGSLLVVGGNAGASWFTLGYAAVVVLFGVGVHYLNQRSVRKHLRPRREELARLLQEVESS